MKDLKLTKSEQDAVLASRERLKSANTKSGDFNKTKTTNEDEVRQSRSTALKVDEKTMLKMFDLHQTVSSDLNKHFYETFERINKLYNISQKQITSRASISKTTITGWKHGKPVGKRSIIRYAVTFSLDLLVVETLLASGGYKFDYSDKKEYAWAYLIMYYAGASLGECDRVLQEVFGFEDNEYNRNQVFLTPVPRNKKQKAL